MQKITTRPDGSICVETINDEPSLTQQQFAEECDVNYIIKKYLATGIEPDYSSKGVYADLTDALDYQSSLNKIVAARTAFETLPSSLRNRFSNDPQQLLSFLHDPKNKTEAQELGLINTPIPTTLNNSIPTPTLPTPPTPTPKT